MERYFKKNEEKKNNIESSLRKNVNNKNNRNQKKEIMPKILKYYFECELNPKIAL
mgnify:CR=1 FL=1